MGSRLLPEMGAHRSDLSLFVLGLSLLLLLLLLPLTSVDASEPGCMLLRPSLYLW